MKRDRWSGGKRGFFLWDWSKIRTFTGHTGSISYAWVVVGPSSSEISSIKNKRRKKMHFLFATESHSSLFHLQSSQPHKKDVMNGSPHLPSFFWLSRTRLWHKPSGESQPGSQHQWQPTPTRRAPTASEKYHRYRLKAKQIIEALKVSDTHSVKDLCEQKSW